tara:strand:- start:7157 stop:7795 length:639 start_codon:yes stop_codon:yes gene_type:complete
MQEVINQYKKSFSENGNSPKSVFWPKGRLDERFLMLTKEITKEKFTLLDYGCGLAHSIDYLNKNYLHRFEYSGVDIVDDFITENKRNFPLRSFQLITHHTEVKGNYDYIISSGAFSMLYVEDENEHKKIVFEILEFLFNRTNVCLSVNFMTDDVDFKQTGAYHQNVKELYDFVQEKLTKRVVIDQSYMPYEYTITLFKNQEIISPENVYVNE